VKSAFAMMGVAVLAGLLIILTHASLSASSPGGAAASVSNGVIMAKDSAASHPAEVK
jgi:hypothetical protein